VGPEDPICNYSHAVHTPPHPTKRQEQGGGDVGVQGCRGEGAASAIGGQLGTLEGGIGRLRLECLVHHTGGLGDDYVWLNKDLKRLAQGLSTAALQAKDAQDEACQARAEAAAMGNKLNQLRCLGGPHIMAGLLRELQDVKEDRGTLEDTVLALATAVTFLMEAGMAGLQLGPANADLDARLTAHATVITGRLDLIRQETKGGGDHSGGHHVHWSRGGHGLGKNQPSTQHLSVYRGYDLHHVSHLGGSHPPGRHDEARGAQGEDQAHLHAVGTGALGPHQCWTVSSQ
jgi:hypothetical protein